QYNAAIDAVLRRSEERHRFEAEHPGLMIHDHELLCVRPLRILRTMTMLFQQLQGFDDELRGLAYSRELQQPGDTKRGDLLLTAVYQHLRWGQLKYAEIAELVPDGNGPKGAAERVRARVKSADQRSVRPRDPDLGMPNKDKPEKRRRGRSSG